MDNKIIQSLWIGSDLSLLEQLSIKSFISNDHEYHLYVYDDINNIPEGTVVKDASEIIPKSEVYICNYFGNSQNYVGFSDVFRIKLLLDKGGIWADLDFVCLKYFDFNDEYVFSSQRSLYDMDNIDKCSVNNGIIKAPKNAPILEDVYKYCLELFQNKSVIDQNIWSDYISKYGFYKYVKKYDTFCKISPTEIRNFLNRNLKVYEVYDKDCYTAHLWNQIINLKRNDILLEKNSIKKKILCIGSIDKDKIYPEDTIYGSWQKKYL